MLLALLTWQGGWGASAAVCRMLQEAPASHAHHPAHEPSAPDTPGAPVAPCPLPGGCAAPGPLSVMTVEVATEVAVAAAPAPRAPQHAPAAPIRAPEPPPPRPALHR